MRRVAGLVLLAFSLCSAQSVTFDKSFLGDKAYQVVQTNDGGYIFAADLDQELKIVKTDPSGYIVWQRTFGGTYGYRRHFPILELDDGYFITTTIIENENSDAILFRLDLNGNILWSKRYGEPLINENGLKTIRAALNSYWLLYNIPSANPSFNKAGIIKIDEEGNIIWEKEYFLETTVLEQKPAYQLIKVKNNFFALAGNDEIIRLTENGDSVWFVRPSIYSSQNTISSTVSEDSNLVVYAYNKLCKIGDDGSILWQKSFNNVGLQIENIGFGKYGLLLKTSWSNSVFVKLEADTNIISMDTLGRLAYHFIQTEDKGFVFAGIAFRSFRGIVLLKTDSTINYIAINFNKLFSYFTGAPENSTLFIFKEYILGWYSKGVDRVNIDYSTNAGDSWINIETNLPADTSIDWIVPPTPTDQGYIRISDASDPSIFDRSDPMLSFIYYQNLDTIVANEIMMWVGNNGMGSHNPITDRDGFYWPGGSEAAKSAIFSDGLVWGGKVDGEIRVNGDVYRYGLKPGRILPDGKADNPLSTKSKIFKIRKNWELLPESTEKQRLKYDYQNWPAELGAPWVDVNEDGIYTPGFDKPKVIGDETLWFVSNDLDTAATRYTYGSDPIGLEVQTTVFGFQREDLKDVVFKKYKVTNKSSTTIEDMYFTYWADDDLGDAGDDYEGFDSTLNMGYVYNADNFDGSGSLYGYGSPPPAVAHMLVQGPIVQASQTDSARYGDAWIKGFKNLKMTSSGMMLKHGHGGDYPSQPREGVYEGTLQWYNDMQGLNWNGNPIINPITGEQTIWPLTGDPVTGTGWYGWPANPGDRRYHVPTGPFNMEPADTQEICIAIFMALGIDNINSITELRNLAGYVQEFYDSELIEILNTKETIAPIGYQLFQNYPNPFNAKTIIKYEVPENSIVDIRIYDILGREVKTLVNNEQKVRWKYQVEFDGGAFASGVYFYRIKADPSSSSGQAFIETKKMVLLK